MSPMTWKAALLSLPLMLAACQDRGEEPRPTLSPEVVHAAWSGVAPEFYRLEGERMRVETLRGSNFGSYTMRVTHLCAEPCALGSVQRRDLADRAGEIAAKARCDGGTARFRYRANSFLVDAGDGWFTRGQDEGVREFAFECRR